VQQSEKEYLKLKEDLRRLLGLPVCPRLFGPGNPRWDETHDEDEYQNEYEDEYDPEENESEEDLDE